MDLKPNNQDYSANSLMASANGAKKTVSLEFHNFLSDIEDMIKETTSLTGEELAIAKTKIIKRVAEAKESVEEMGEELSHRARKTAKMTDNYVHDEPWKAMGASAVVGLLLGFVLARRS